MPSLPQLTAAPTTIQLRGATYHLAPLSVRDLGRIERMATAMHADPARASLAEVHLWLCGREGTAYALWLALRRGEQEVTGAWCREVISASTPEELASIQRSLDEACGASLLATDATAHELQHQPRSHWPIPWERIFRAFGRAYGWTPREVARLTLGQMVAYLDDAPQPPSRVRLPAAEARALARQKKAGRRESSAADADRADDSRENRSEKRR